MVSPSDEYLVIDTPHFRIMHNAEQQKLGEHYAVQLERAFSFLDPKFSHRPEKTVVVILDATDSSNGYATPVPYPHMVLYPVLPVTQEALGEASEWSLELATHEYTHVLSFYPATGFMGVLRSIFGSVVAPNALMPRWWLEGVAVYAESTVTGKGGRLRSLYQEGTLRSMTEAKTLFSYDMGEINEILPDWPAARPYLFGSIFWASALEKKSDSAMRDLTAAQSSRVPYFIESPAKKYLGMKYTPFYNQALMDLNAKLEVQLKTLNQVAPTKGQLLNLNQHLSYWTAEIEMSTSPAISGDGKFLALVATDEYFKKNLRIYSRSPEDGFLTPLPFKSVDSAFDENESKVFDQLPSGAIQKVSWFHQKNQLIYDKIDMVSSLQSFSDLYTYDLGSKKTQRLTKKQRAREPAVSLDDRQVVFVQLSGGKTELATLDLQTKDIKILYAGEFDEIISHPLFWSSHEIVFSHRLTSGVETLKVIDLRSNDVRPLFSDHKLARFPVRFENQLYFTSGLNGVFNIYRASGLDAPPRAITHFTNGGALTFDVLPKTKQIIATLLTEKGPRVQLVPVNESLGRLPAVEKVFQPKTAPLPSDAGVDSSTFTSSSYSPYQYLLPHYWIPFLGTSTAHNGLIIQASTGSSDPLQYHSYSLLAEYDTYLKKPSGYFNYLNNTMDTSVLLSSAYVNSYLVDPRDVITKEVFNLSLLPDLFNWHPHLLGVIGGYSEKSKIFDRKYETLGGQFLLGYYDVNMSMAQITPQDGKSFFAGLRQSRDQARAVDLTQFIFYGSYYESRFLPRYHGIRLRTSGLITTTDVNSFYGKISDSYLSSSQDFLMRGYKTGQLLGRTTLNFNLDYGFPVWNISKGWGTNPYFLRRLHGAFVADHGRVDGFVFNEPSLRYESVNTGKGFTNVGLEARLDLTLGYVLPLQLALGYYQPLETKYSKDPFLIGLQVRGMAIP